MAITTDCARCLELERRLALLEGEVWVLTWVLRRLAYRTNQPRLARLLDRLLEEEEEKGDLPQHPG
jgi:hypothetical protein